MKDYSKMSDAELNKLITGFQFDCHDWPQNINGDFYHCGFDGDAYFVIGVKDYCNNPSDAWPITHGNDIMLNPNCADELWKAVQGFREKPSGFYDVATAYNKNPLRAAMIVFLMMQDVE